MESSAGAASSRLRPTVAGCVLAVVVVLTAGWPLAARSLDDQRSLAPGRVLRLGPGDEAASLRVPDAGWSLSASDSDPDVAYAFSRPGVDLRAAWVGLGGPDDVPLLWPGLRRVLRVSDPHSRLGPPRTALGADGTRGRTGELRVHGRPGAATVWTAADAGAAVEITVLADSDADPAALGAAAALVHSVTFPGDGP